VNAVVEIKDTLDAEINMECPVCSKLRDPKTGALPYNARVLVAIEETEAMMRGDIPVNWHKPDELGKVLKELLED